MSVPLPGNSNKAHLSPFLLNKIGEPMENDGLKYKAIDFKNGEIIGILNVYI